MKFYVCNKCDKLIVDFEEQKDSFIHCEEEMMEVFPKEEFDDIHKPIYQQIGSLVKISVGEPQHEMIDIHHIKFIGVETNEGVYFKYLNKYDKPETMFIINEFEHIKKIYVYCNIHLLYCLNLTK